MPAPVSVIIPTYNRRKQLAFALDSILNQETPPAEIIVVDDGSTDDTASYLKSHYPGIQYYLQTHHGVSRARNLGIKKARYPWIALLDSDDRWTKNKLEQQMTALSRTGDLICHTDEIWIRHGIRVNPHQKHKKKGGWLFQACLPLCAISPSSVLIHCSIFKCVGLFDETLPACEDYDLWLRITAYYPVLYVDLPLTLKYGGHSDQLSRQYWGMDRFRIVALQNIIKDPNLTTDDRNHAINTLKKKVSVYITGAKKRAKHDEVNYYENLLATYSS